MSFDGSTGPSGVKYVYNLLTEAWRKSVDAFAIGATSTVGEILENTTAAAAGAQQYSPRRELAGQGWKTTSTAASQRCAIGDEVRPVQGSTAPSFIWALMKQIAVGGSWTDLLTLTSDGVLALTGRLDQIKAWAIGVTSTAGHILENSTAAAAGAQQYSPRRELAGKGWKTDSTAASVDCRVGDELRPVQGSSAPSFVWALMQKIGTGSWGDILTVTSAGLLSALSLCATGDGGGTASSTTLTNGTVAAGATPATLGNAPAAAGNTGWIKIYVGATAYAIPYWPAA